MKKYIPQKHYVHDYYLKSSYPSPTKTIFYHYFQEAFSFYTSFSVRIFGQKYFAS